VELTDGHLEFQPMPDELHQAIVLIVVDALRSRGGGKVIMAPFPVRVAPRKFREPDVAFMKDENAPRRRGTHWEGADVVMEVVSESNRKRDTETKRREYALAGIPEYWIIDPSRESITVLALAGEAYDVAGEYGPGHRAVSVHLLHFELDVDTVLRADS
jgi:Uma2 family endonuclease